MHYLMCFLQLTSIELIWHRKDFHRLKLSFKTSMGQIKSRECFAEFVLDRAVYDFKRTTNLLNRYRMIVFCNVVKFDETMQFCEYTNSLSLNIKVQTAKKNSSVKLYSSTELFGKKTCCIKCCLWISPIDIVVHPYSVHAYTHTGTRVLHT